MLTSLVLFLKAETAGTLPASLGRAGQAVLLKLIQERDPALATALHEGDGMRPYTASNLVLGKRERGALLVTAGQTGWLRFTGLTEAVSQQLAGLAADPPPAIEVEGHRLSVTGATLDPADHPWAGQSSYQSLAAPFLLGGQKRISAKIGLNFTTPTTFRSKGRMLPLPLPELVFGSLLDRWQRFAPIALPPQEVRRFAEEVLVLNRYQVRTRGVPYKSGGMLIGFTGSVIFSALNRDPYWLNVLHLLTDFAFYSGVGYQTGSGLGQVRRLAEHRPGPGKGGGSHE